MRKLLLLFTALCGFAAVQADEINAISATQGSQTDWFRFSDQNAIVVTINDAGNPVFPGNKIYNMSDGSLLTMFGTTPIPTIYTREGLHNGKLGTICLAYAVEDVEDVDATFYQLNYFDGISQLYIEEVSALAAGMPYIFEAKAESFTVNLTITEAPAPAGDYNGLYGALSKVEMTSDATHSYAAIVNNEVNVVDKGYTVTVLANRAYIDMNQVPTTEQPHSAPLRALGVPRQLPTDINTLPYEDGIGSAKFIHNGHFIILRDGKRYNALGL